VVTAIKSGVGPVIMGRHLPPEYITMVVRHGFLAMPAFPASFIDDQSLQDIANYVSQTPATKK
jgi:mono/diheme cytochrome c family protein